MSTKSLGTLSLDLIVQTGGFESGMDKAERVADAKTRKIERLAQERAKSIETAFGSMARNIAGPLAAAFSVSALSGFISSLSEAQQQADKLRNSLTYSTGSAAGAAKELGYLRDVTRTLGLDFNSASQAYAKFAAATKGSSISAKQTKDVFEGIAAASAKMGLSADETQGALLALSQMASKGTVQAEELRGQLGERLPGAFKIAAQAMGVTQAELGKLLETGQVLASDFLPKFGAALKNEFGGSVNSLTQEINRLNSSWDIWKQSLANSDGGGFRWITNGLNESAAAMRSLGSEAGVVQKILAAIGGFEFGAIGEGKFDTTKLQEQAMQRLAEVKAQRKPLESRDYLTQFEKQNLADLKREEQAIRDQIMALAVRRGKETGFAMPDIAGDFLAQKTKADERTKAYLDNLSNAPKAVKIAAEVEKENKAFEAAVVGLSETDDRYVAALKAHKSRVAEINKAGSGTAKTSTQLTEGQRLIEQLRERLISTENLTEVEKLQAQFADTKYSKATAGEQAIAMGIAGQIDARKALMSELDAELTLAKKLTAEYTAQDARLQSLIGATDHGKNTQNLLDEALAESALRSGTIVTSTYDQILEKLREVKDTGKETTDALSIFAEQAARNMQDAFANFLFDPFKDGASGMLKNFGTMIQKMVAQAVAADLSKNIFGKAGGGEGTGWLGAGLDWLKGLVPNAKGGVYTSPGLSAFSGGVYDKPQAFAFAKGAGIFAEAGPEAIMPLSRGSDGKLGVKAQGSGQPINITVHVNGNSNAPDVRRAAGQGAREALAAFQGAQRYA